MSLLGCALALAIVSPGAYGYGGLPGLYGYLLGVVTTSLNLWAWYALIGLAGRVAVETETPKGGTLLVFLTFLMKLPIFVALYFFSRSLGEDAPSCFLAGVVLVYFALVGWALGRS